MSVSSATRASLSGLFAVGRRLWARWRPWWRITSDRGGFRSWRTRDSLSLPSSLGAGSSAIHMNGFCEIPTLRNPCFCSMFAWLADDGSARHYGVSGMVCHVNFFLGMFVFYRLLSNSVRMPRFSRRFCLWSTMIQRDIIIDEVGVKGCMPWCACGLCCPDPALYLVAARLWELTGGPCGIGCMVQRVHVHLYIFVFI
ncbi:unnamed protein product [Ectocarpus sp. 6 AP-2014]